MKKNSLSAAIILALSASSAVAADRTDLNSLVNSYTKNATIDASVVETSGKTWLVKASGSAAVSVADVALSNASGVASIGNSADVLYNTEAGLDQLEAQILSLGLDITIKSNIPPVF